MPLPLLLFALLAVPPQETPAVDAPVDAPAETAKAAPAPAAAPGSIATGLDLYRKRRFKAAEAEFQRAVDADPQNAAAHFYLGYTLYKIAEPTKRLTPDKQRASEEFAKAYSIDPTFTPAWGHKS